MGNLCASAALLLAAGAAFGAAPITFEQNCGQAPDGVAFLARVGSGRLLLARDGSATVLGSRASVRVALPGAKAAAPIGLDALSAKSNYLIGRDPSAWRTGILHFRAVKFAAVYPRIDLLWHSRGGELEHDFVVNAGGDPDAIRIRITGAEPELRGEELLAGEIRLREPRAFQNGREIACRYLKRGRSFGFALGPYDRSQPLTIDPVLSFSTLLTGTQGSAAAAVALDGSGNIYMAGTTMSADFLVTAGVVQPKPGGGNCSEPYGYLACPDIFVSKFTSDGNTLLFSTYLGGMGQNTLAGMAVDKQGNVYLTGTAPPDFPALKPLPGSPAMPPGPFVAKLSADGASLLYSTMLPAASLFTVAGIAVDGSGAAYLTGSVYGDLPLVHPMQSSISKPLVYRSTDSATHWQPLGAGIVPQLVTLIAADPTNPETLYLGTETAFYKSTDAGATWTALLTKSPPQSPYPDEMLWPTTLAIDPAHPQTLYLGIQINGVYKSTDGGATWSPAFAGVSRFIRMLAIDPVHTSTLYAATDEGVYKSTDGAATWNVTSLSAPRAFNFAHNLAIDPSNPSTIYAGTNNGVMKSLDEGATWMAMNNGFTPSLDITTLVIDPQSPQTLYASTTGTSAPFRSTDGGTHWTQVQWGSEDYVVWLAIDPQVHTTIWAVTSEGLRVSRDSGVTWTEAPTNLAYYNPQRIAAAADGTLYAIANDFTSDGFVLKLDPTGTYIVYSTYLGGSGPDSGKSIAVDAAGRAYVLGMTLSFDFPTASALQPNPGGFNDAFVSVLDAAGAHLVWSTYVGGSKDDLPEALALDPAGNIHIAGFTVSPDFPLRQAAQTTLPPNQAAFVTKMKGDGSGLIFSTYLGGSTGDIAYGVAADAAGNTYATGMTQSADFPLRNPIQSSFGGASDAFIAEWNGQTGALQFSTYLGGSGNETGTAIVADTAGNAYVTGQTSSPDFPLKYSWQYPVANPFGTTLVSAFLAKLSPSAAGPTLALDAITDAATYSATVAPGGLISVFGSALAVTAASASTFPLPRQLSDVTVDVNGVPAPLLFVSARQVNAQVPFETKPGTAVVQVNSTAGTASLNVTVAAAAPAIFSAAGIAAIEHGATGQLVTASNPAAPGETISIFCTGLGAVSPAGIAGAAAPYPAPQTLLPVQATIGGMDAAVTFAGLAPGFAGLYQVNAVTPPSASGPQTLVLHQNGSSSAPVTIAVR